MMPDWFQPAWDTLAAVGALVIAAVKWAHARLAKVEGALTAHKLYAAETFATKRELSDTEKDIKSACARIEGKLDTLLLQRSKGIGE